MAEPHTTRADGLTVYTSEAGVVVRADAGALMLHFGGCLDETEAVAVMTAALDLLAKRRGVQPALIANRTPPNLIAALRGS